MNILYPMMTLFGLTLLLTFRLGMMRFAAVRRGDVKPGFYALYRDGEEPEKLAALSRHIVNLYEAPVLFYLVSVVAFISGLDGMLILGLAWGYVALRLAHSYIHLTSNRLILRFRFFALSMFTLTALWLTVLISMLWS